MSDTHPVITRPPPPPWWLRARFAVPVIAALTGAACLIDQWGYGALVDKSAETKDWSKMLRMAGYLPTWIIVAGALLLAVRARDALRTGLVRAGMILGGATLAGGVGEVLKVLIRRARPNATDGLHTFIPFDAEWTKGFGLPSTHTAVAFGAAYAIAMLWPRTGLLMLLVALGCGFTRVQSGAHFVSDVMAGALVGFVGAWSVMRVGRVIEDRRASRTVGTSHSSAHAVRSGAGEVTA